MLVLRFGRFVACVLSLIIFAGVSPAQTTQGGIVGAVRDEKGANILGAKITVTSPRPGYNGAPPPPITEFFAYWLCPRGCMRFGQNHPASPPPP